MLKQFAQHALHTVLPRRAYALLRRAYRRRRMRAFPARRVRHTYGGFSLEVALEDAMAAAWYDMDWPDLPEIALLQRHGLRAGARVFDIGAHQGIVALMLARVVGPDGQVIAAEPDPWNVRVLRKNVELNQPAPVKVVPAVITDWTGSLLSPPGVGSGDASVDLYEWGLSGVEALTLDALVEVHGRPDVLFIDVDGFESAVLRGARMTLAGRPDCFVEVHVGAGLERQGGSAAEVLAHFPTSHYDLFIASEDERGFVPFSPTSPLLKSRFFLVAIARGRDDSSAQ